MNLVLGCVSSDSLHQTVNLVLGCVSSESLPVFLAPDRMAHRLVCFIAYIYVSTLLQCHFTTQQSPMSSWTGDDDGSLGPALWSQQDPEFNSNFPVLDKRDFKSMRDVRKYAPNQMVNWPRCAHGEFCVMQIYQGWDNSGRRFWHCSRAWVSKTP